MIMPGNATTPRSTTSGSVCNSAFSVYLDMVNHINPFEKWGGTWGKYVPNFALQNVPKKKHTIIITHLFKNFHRKR
jgi:hypothetical protein